MLPTERPVITKLLSSPKTRGTAIAIIIRSFSLTRLLFLVSYRVRPSSHLLGTLPTYLRCTVLGFDDNDFLTFFRLIRIPLLLDSMPKKNKMAFLDRAEYFPIILRVCAQLPVLSRDLAYALRTYCTSKKSGLTRIRRAGDN